MIKIDKQFPIPVAHHKLTYPWHNMTVGDSFFTTKRPGNITVVASNLGFKFSTRKEGKGFRVWRIA